MPPPCSSAPLGRLDAMMLPVEQHASSRGTCENWQGKSLLAQSRLGVFRLG